jgi:hypothetical protein
MNKCNIVHGPKPCHYLITKGIEIGNCTLQDQNDCKMKRVGFRQQSLIDAILSRCKYTDGVDLLKIKAELESYTLNNLIYTWNNISKDL